MNEKYLNLEYFVDLFKGFFRPRGPLSDVHIQRLHLLFNLNNGIR